MKKIDLNKKKDKEIDIFLEGKKVPFRNLHPINQIIKKIYDVLLPLGYQITKSPEIDNIKNNFDKLNVPLDHPSRNIQQTFYLNKKTLLRTHNTTNTSRVLSERSDQKMKIISAGKVYRPDENDATHTHQFTQIDGFVVGKNVTIIKLKKTLKLILNKIFGKEIIFRFRSSYFPFTDPSIEADIKCLKCRGFGCNICKKEGWIEVLGAGMLHHQVLKNCGFKDRSFTGFAFGLGVERLAMIKYEVEDIRNFYLNDIRFLKQFKGE